ncbi:putative LPS assembly protein LptD [Flavobacterium antarcticum]|uniref:putative LPS assembly protein LptD n=1 Tax=Flavobacterium antarcticum TaxID=271155 RepID=UPI0003B6151E|nr:putative LPS assembly protein LptD [Flavobacterium antarcticum]
MVIIYKNTYFDEKNIVSLTHQIVRHIFTKIAFKLLRTNLFHIVLSAIFLTLGTSNLHSQEKPKKLSVPIPEKKEVAADTISIQPLQVPKKELDSTKSDTVKKKKSVLEGIVKRTAVDYERIDQKKKLVTLYNQAELHYLDVVLKSGIIVMDYAKNEVYAGRIKDSAGNFTQRPVFTQGSNVVEPDSIRFNFKTKKVLIWNSRSKQGELNFIAQKAKKENDSVYFMENVKFTTAEDIDDPEYYFLARKAKFVPKKKVVVGLTNMYIADVPTPIGLPFAFFPMTETSQSGVILPTFNDTRRQGYSLQNGGYYFALSDNYDLTFLGDYYTNGSYAMRFESSYAKRYRFTGNVNIRFENQITSERGFPDYAKSNEYNIQWTHSQDPKSNPNSRFSASVNLGSSTYFRNSLNQMNVGSQLNNNLSSSISYSKTFNSVPSVNFSVTANHSQNTQTEEISMTLPTLQLSVDRVFPFASEDQPKKGFIKNINFQYNLRGENRIRTNDSLFFKSEMFRDAKVGFQHSIPINTNFKVFKHFSVSTGVNYNEVWYLKTLRKEFDQDQGRVVESEVNKFDAYRTYSFSSSVGTTVYGTFDFGESKKIQSIRHVMRPSVSYNYTPSFEKYFDTYALDASGTMQKDYTRFEGGIFGAPGKTYSNNVGFTLNNTFEAKVTSKDSTSAAPRKVMLLNNLLFATSYNIAADSLQWDPLRVSGGTLLFKDKMNVNFGATFDPYAIDNAGKRIKKYNIDNGGSLFRMTSANMTINYSLSSTGDGKKEKDNTQGARNGGREDDLFGTNVDFSERRESQFTEENKNKEQSEFFTTDLPWDLTFAYSLTYGNMTRQNEIIGNSIMISGNIDISPKWKIGVSTGYDFVQQGVTFTQLRFERDLLSWRMDFNWTPFGENAYWGFFIGIKSGMLSDIKWEKRTQPARLIK